MLNIKKIGKFLQFNSFKPLFKQNTVNALFFQQQKFFFNFSKKRKEEPESDSDEEITQEKYSRLGVYYNELNKKLEVYKTKLEELEEQYNQELEDKQRIIERSEKEIKNAEEYGHSKLAKDILEVHDNIERALNAIPEKPFSELEETEKNEILRLFAEGIIMTKEGFTKILNRHAIHEFSPLKERFDPKKHEKVSNIINEELVI
jgi:molecular chaperone GrpE